MLSIVVCAAPAAAHARALIELAIDRGWDVAIAATPSALAFIDQPELEHLTGHPVHSTYRRPDEPRHRGLPAPTAVLVAPATFNTINKLAAGITDTYALGHISDAIGNHTPVLLVPFVNAALANRRPFRQALDDLRSEDVHVLFNDERRPPHPPGTGETQPLPWKLAIDELQRLTAGPHRS
jgi:phosphopantothenoylcysteine synthetase/decarboxylase